MHMKLRPPPPPPPPSHASFVLSSSSKKPINRAAEGLPSQPLFWLPFRKLFKTRYALVLEKSIRHSSLRELLLALPSSHHCPGAAPAAQMTAQAGPLCAVLTEGQRQANKTAKVRRSQCDHIERRCWGHLPVLAAYEAVT